MFLPIAVIFIFISSRDKLIFGFMQTHTYVLQHNLKKSAAELPHFRSGRYENDKSFHPVVLAISSFLKLF